MSTVERKPAGAEDKTDLAQTELNHLVSALSHDLSAHLMLLNNSFQHLKQQCDQQQWDSLSEDAAHMDASLTQSVCLLDDLSTLAKTGDMRMQPERIELSQVVGEVLFEQHDLHTQRGVQVELEPDLPAVWCHPTRVQQVITNLMLNAVKHGCGLRGGRITIARHPSAEQHLATIVLRDEGPGIPASARREIFLPGHRLSGTQAAGSGMGLAIVRQIVEHYGGSIRVDPDWREGAAFILSLPKPPPAES